MIVGGPILYHCELSVWKLEILMEIKIRALNVKGATMFTAQNLYVTEHTGCSHELTAHE